MKVRVAYLLLLNPIILAIPCAVLNYFAHVNPAYLVVCAGILFGVGMMLLAYDIMIRGETAK
jgi:hypothetical protein